MACPVHKKAFSLESGKCLSGEDYAVQVFPVKVEGNDVYVQVPVAHENGAEGRAPGTHGRCVDPQHFAETGEGVEQPCLIS